MAKKLVRIDEALERLREAESFYGSTVVVTPPFMHEGRLRWLAGVRDILLENEIEIENLSGPWHTEQPRKEHV